MAVPARPNVVITLLPGETVGVTAYESLDNVDETLYNQIGPEYLRAAFIDIISKWRKDTAAGVARTPLIANGHDIERLWENKKAYWGKKRKRSRMIPRPHGVALPPAPVAGPPAASPPVLPPPANSPPANSPPANSPPANSPPANLPLSSPESPHNSPAVGERSPIFIQDRPHDHIQGPTRGQREVMSEHNDGDWKFARVLYQRQASTVRMGPNGAREVLRPWKAVWLLVRTSETGTIEARIVSKFLILWDPTDETPAIQEISMNEKLVTVGCKQILQWRGSGKRTKVQRIVGKEPESKDEYYMYTDFASLGTLYDIADPYEDKELDGITKHVPEHFIWYFLGELADALLVLKTGRCESSDAPQTSATPWMPILHNDIKDINIALDAGNIKYPTYPRILLFDFDLAEAHEDVSKSERVMGTQIWTPPERLGDDAQYENYVPRRWSLSEKADLWSVGLAAFQLMKAVDGTSDFYNLMTALVKRFLELPSTFHASAFGEEASVFPMLLSDPSMPPQYSVELCRTVQACLQYHPDDRPDLRKILTTSRRQLESLDRIHRQEFSKDRDSILEDFRLEYNYNKYSAFDVGAHFEPQRSRRHRFYLPETDANYDLYKTHLSNWEDTGLYPRPSLHEQLATMTSIAAFIEGSDLDVIHKICDSAGDSATTLAWRHLYSTICLEISPSAKVYVSYDSTVKGYQRAFSTEYKLEALDRLLDHILPGMASDPDQDHIRNSLHVLQHASDWGRALLMFAGEPVKPILKDSSAMHRAIRNYALEPQPAIRGAPETHGDDVDEDDDEQIPSRDLARETSLSFSYPTGVRVLPESQRPAAPDHYSPRLPGSDESDIKYHVPQETNHPKRGSTVPETPPLDGGTHHVGHDHPASGPTIPETQPPEGLLDYDSDGWA